MVLENLSDLLENNMSTHGNRLGFSKQHSSTTVYLEKELLDNVLLGKITDLPEPPSNVVKIYVCSTKSDFENERQRLWEDTLPELQQLFIPYGLDVQLVDMHQGCDMDAVYDRCLFDQHLHEIAECHRLSMGPFFLCMIGDKYGPVPLPAKIDEEEFNLIKADLADSKKDVKLLEEWYVKDDNAIPAAYALQPIESHFKHYNNRQPGATQLYNEAIEGWLKIFDKLQGMLQHAATARVEDSKNKAAIHKQQCKYFQSAVEQQIEVALKLCPHKCFFVKRKIGQLPEEDGAPELYVDVRNKKCVDSKAQKKLNRLSESLLSRVNERNITNFFIQWREHGLAPGTYDEHADYLADFHEAIVTFFQKGIESNLNERRSLKLDNERYVWLYKEVSAHNEKFAKHAAQFRSHLLPLEESIKTVFANGSKNDHQMPVVLGPDGSGKSCVLGSVARMALDILGEDTILIVRQVGLTPESTTNWDLLWGICLQIQYALNEKINPNAYSLDKLTTHFQDLLKAFSNGARHLVFIIDSIELIKSPGQNTESKFSWLLGTLPPHIHLISSMCCSSQTVDMLNILKSKLCQDEAFINLPVLKQDDISRIIKETLAKQKRRLTEEQSSALLKATREQGRPLHLSLLLKDVPTWNSHTSPNSIGLTETLEITISSRFEILEELYGKEVISQIVRYICSAVVGLTEMELLDILSCNNQLLIATVSDILPTLRFPYKVWLDVKNILGIFLEERHLDNKTLYCWSHHVIAKMAAERYRGVTEEIKQSHKDIADLFLGTWLGTKPISVPDKNIQIIDTGVRYISQQPLLYSETEYNFRRLRELWYQLLHSGEVDKFKEQCACNFEYLIAKIHSSHLHSMITDMQTTSSQLLDAEICMIFKCIIQSVDILSTDPLQLASELIGRLRQIKQYYPNHIEPLVQQCMEWCDAYHLPIILPLSSWQRDPCAPLVISFNCPDAVTCICPTQNSQHLFIATSKNVIKMYNVPSKKLIKTLTGHKAFVTCMKVSHSNKFLVSGSADTTLRVWDINSGKNTLLIREHVASILCMVLTKSDKTVITGSKDETLKVIALETGQVIHTKKELSGPVICLVLNNNDTILASSASDKVVKVWYLEDMSLLYSIEEDIASPVISMALSLDNTFLLIGCEDKSLCVKSFTTGSSVHQLEGHIGKVQSIAVSADSYHCVVSCSDGHLHIYNLRTKELLQTFPNQSQSTMSIGISTEENFIFSATKDRVNVWLFLKRFTIDVPSDQHKEEVTCLAISQDGKSAATGGKDHMVKLWNLEISDFHLNLEGHQATVTCVAFEREEAFVVSGSADCTIKVWSVAMGCMVRNYQEHSGIVTSVFVLDDRQKVLSADDTGILKLWDASSGVTDMSLDGHTHLLSVTSNGKVAVAGNSDKSSAKLWSVMDGFVIKSINHSAKITCVTFSYNCQNIVTGSEDNSLKVWEANTGKLTQVLVGHSEAVSCVAVSNNNKHVVSGSHDKQLLVWGLNTGEVKCHLKGHTDIITCVKLTADGSTAISGSKDGTLRVWSVNHGLPVTVFDMHMPVDNLYITRDAGRIMVKLLKSPQMPFLCLHNSPASDVKSQSLIDIHIAGDSAILPIKPRPLLQHHSPAAFNLSMRRKRVLTRQPSVSTIPEIIKVSPMRAPLQKTVKAQEEKKCGKMSLSRTELKKKIKAKNEPAKKKSSICVIL